MRLSKLFTIVFVLLLFCIPCTAQYAYRIKPVTALPATCNPLNGDVRSLTTGGITTVFHCTGTNTWTPAGTGTGNVLTINQGTLTGASTPFISQTATWNNGATVFTNIFSNITNTASNANSRLIALQVGGVEAFSVDVNAITRSNTQFKVPISGFFSFDSASNISSGVDGLLVFMNSTLNGFSQISLGPGNDLFPAIKVSPAVAGQTQGISIVKSNGNAAVHANLGAAVDGSMIYCSDCTIASPCAAGGTGAIAKRLNGVWVCN